MKRIIFTLLAILITTLSFGQTRISTEGGSFIIQDLSNPSDYGKPYPKINVFANQITSSRVEIRLEGITYNPKVLTPLGGIEYTELRNGNNADAVFPSVTDAVSWFTDNTTTSEVGLAKTSTVNSTNTISGDGWTGNNYLSPGEQNDYHYAGVNLQTDEDGKLTFEFSQDGVNWSIYPFKEFTVTSGINEVHAVWKGGRYIRVKFTGTGGRTYFRLSTYYTNQPIFLTSPLNQPIGSDADATTARTIGEDITLAEGKFGGYSIVSKLGKNIDIDTGTTPEDVWDGGGTYTGFPISTIENLEVVSTSATDLGTIRFLYLSDDQDGSYNLGTANLMGVVPVDTGIPAWRVHTAWYDSGDDTTFNQGDITIRHATTESNVFIFIPAGRSQSNACVYTIPKGSTGYITNINVQVRRSASTAIDGAIWVRTPGASPRLRQPYSASQNARLSRDIIRFPLEEGTDVMLRIISTGANNTDVVGGMQIRLVSND